MRNCIVLFVFILIAEVSLAQQLAFPGAEGFGKYTTGGRGGTVYEVTNLNDNGTGSLRAAIQKSGARTIVFRISGTIFLQSQLDINNGDLTIAGQTAPGDGITLANYNFEIKADNVIIRYIRSRMGDLVNQVDDAFTCRYQKNIMIDHCTFSWGIDEVASTYINEYFTMQWCIISESLYRSVHEKGDHGYGGIWGGSRVTFHHNLLAHHSSRNPRFNGARYKSAPWEEIVDYRNNVIYNWGSNSAYGGDPSETDGIKASINMVGNYYKPGPGTRTNQVRYRILEPYDMSSFGYSNFYIDSNFVEGSPDASADNWTWGVQNVSEAEKSAMRVNTPFEFDITTKHTAHEAYEQVLAGAGAVLPQRDTVDKRIAWEVENGTATYGGAAWGANTGIIDTQDDVGGWPELFSAPASPDRDHDGMPDSWELEKNLDPEDPEDRNGDYMGTGYTNLEYYLNSIPAYHDFMKPPSKLNIESGEQTIILMWTDNSTAESGFFLERKMENQEFSVIDTLPANSVIYNDEGLLANTIYSYRLKAFGLTDTSVYSEIATVSTITGIPGSLKNQGIHLYLDPLNNSVTVSCTTDHERITMILLADLSGRMLLQNTGSTNGNLFRLNIGQLMEGTYIIIVKTQSTTFTRKFNIVR